MLMEQIKNLVKHDFYGSVILFLKEVGIKKQKDKIKKHEKK